MQPRLAGSSPTKRRGRTTRCTSNDACRFVSLSSEPFAIFDLLSRASDRLPPTIPALSHCTALRGSSRTRATLYTERLPCRRGLVIVIITLLQLRHVGPRRLHAEQLELVDPGGVLLTLVRSNEDGHAAAVLKANEAELNGFCRSRR